MSLNPEFRRNLWLHISWQRLFAAPTVMALAVAAFVAFSPDKTYQAAQLACFVILGLWGTRRAADSLSEEVSGGTWESQRMSGLGAWQMAWGKLIGGTAFVWYCAAFALLILVAARLQTAADPSGIKPIALVVYNFVAGGLFAHCISFAVAIVLLRKTVSYRRLTITLAQTCGFVTFLAFAYSGLGADGGGNAYQGVQGMLDPSTTIYVLDTEMQMELKKAIAITIFGAWTILAIYRLMRLELQYRNWPWAWAAFVAFMLLFGATLGQARAGPLAWLPCMTLMGAALTYLSLFADVRDPVRYRWALRAIWSGDFGQALAYTPWWLVSFLATIGSAIATILRVDKIDDILDVSRLEFFRFFGAPTLAQLQISLVLLLLFLLRDILFVIWLSAGPRRHRADVTGLVSLVVAYVPLAGILWGFGGKNLMPLVMPVAFSGNPLDLAPILVEVGIIGALLYVRWEAATRLSKKY